MRQRKGGSSRKGEELPGLEMKLESQGSGWKVVGNKAQQGSESIFQLRSTRLERENRLYVHINDPSNYVFKGVKPFSHVAFLIASVQHILTNTNSMEAGTNLPGLDASLFRLFGYVLCCECREPFTIPGSCQIVLIPAYEDAACKIFSMLYLASYVEALQSH
ncbi:hypothetical protein LOAG_02697 [Loa loa]|uniref:Uncharacterized protein n=1 Tax=Loa loa TaxID=7209 RepID=A0A1S0U6L1_LOALO|nr:hypothetical protein LOAG_02697 [Loa loa]EFO25789.1 hypothetical protein LOAG_02697 [Loa loa]